MNTVHLKERYLKHIFDIIQDGIIIMDETRKIVTMNPSASKLTGWKLHGYVPYCSYCEEHRQHVHENKCYLIAREEVPYFLSEMPTYHGKKINVEMSTALIVQDKKQNKKEYLLVLRDQSVKKKEEEVDLSKQIIKMLIEAKENEHKRLAQELHDGVGQSLYTIAVALQAVESFVDDKDVLSYISDVREELDQAMNDIKTYAYQLRPQSLDRLGLVAAVKEMIKMVEKSHPEITFNLITNLEETFSSMVKINLYRIIQEAVLNIVKYANATQVMIELAYNTHELLLTISDNGIGFDPNDKTIVGLGLKHMEERMNQIGGDLMIQSIKGQGTSIIASIAKGSELYD